MLNLHSIISIGTCCRSCTNAILLMSLSKKKSNAKYLLMSLSKKKSNAKYPLDICLTTMIFEIRSASSSICLLRYWSRIDWHFSLIITNNNKDQLKLFTKINYILFNCLNNSLNVITSMISFLQTNFNYFDFIVFLSFTVWERSMIMVDLIAVDGEANVNIVKNASGIHV